MLTSACGNSGSRKKKLVVLLRRKKNQCSNMNVGIKTNTTKIPENVVIFFGSSLNIYPDNFLNNYPTK